MLNAMRENLRHLKWILWAVAISLTLYLGAFFSGDVRQGGGNWAARVNGEEISVQAFRKEAEQMDARYKQLLGDQYQQLKSSFALGSQTIESLIVREIVRQEAEKLGFTASEEEVRDHILKDPALQDANGNFVGGERLKRWLQRTYRGGPEAYEADVAQQIAGDKWQSVLFESVFVTDAELEDLYRRRNEKTAIRYVLVPSSEQETPTAVTASDIDAWYQAHQEDFRKPAGREIAFLVVERQKIAETIEVAETEIQGFYDENSSRYTRPEQRRARHILIRVEPGTPEAEKELIRRHAESILQRVRGGEDFETLAKATSQDPGSAERGGDLGYFGRGDMVPPFEQSAFDTPVGEFAPLTESQFGFHVIQVTDARQAGVTPLDEVRDAIQRELTQRRAQEMLGPEADRLASAVSSVEELRSIALEEGYEVEERVVTPDDRLADLGASPEFLDTVMSLEVGEVSQPLPIARGMAVVALEAENPSAVAPLEEVEAEVRTAILNDRAVSAAVEAARAALASHGTVDAMAGALGKEVQDSGDLAPGRIVLPRSGGDSPELRAALFHDAVAEGDTGVTAVPAGAVVYEVTRRVGFDAAALEASRTALRMELLNQKRMSLLQQTLAKLRETYDVTVNAELVEAFNG